MCEVIIPNYLMKCEVIPYISVKHKGDEFILNDEWLCEMYDLYFWGIHKLWFVRKNCHFCQIVHESDESLMKQNYLYDRSILMNDWK